MCDGHADGPLNTIIIIGAAAAAAAATVTSIDVTHIFHSTSMSQSHGYLGV